MSGLEEPHHPTGPRVCHFCGFSVEIAASLEAFLGRFLRCYAEMRPTATMPADRQPMRETLQEYLEDMVEVPTWKSAAGKRRKVVKWAHENCANWSVGVYSKNGKRQGIPIALATARNAACLLCKRIGASVCCDVATLRGHQDVTCKNVLHFPCALLLFEEDQLHMDSDGLMMYCPQHQHLALGPPPKQPVKQSTADPTKGAAGAAKERPPAPAPASAAAKPTKTAERKKAAAAGKPEKKDKATAPSKRQTSAPTPPPPTPVVAGTILPSSIQSTETPLPPAAGESTLGAAVAVAGPCSKPKAAQSMAQPITAQATRMPSPTRDKGEVKDPDSIMAAPKSPAILHRESTRSHAVSTPSLTSEQASPTDSPIAGHSPGQPIPLTLSPPSKPCQPEQAAAVGPSPGPPQEELVAAIAAVLRYETFMGTEALVEQLSARLANVSLSTVLSLVRDLHEKGMLFYDEDSKAVYTL